MILTGNEIKKNTEGGIIRITPFNENHINPNSYDLSIGNTICYYHNDIVLNALGHNNIITEAITSDGLVLKRNKFYFAESHERIMVDNLVPLLHTKSGVARKGLFAHITADLLQLSHNGTVLLQLYPTTDIVIYPYQKIAQISFWKIWDK